MELFGLDNYFYHGSIRKYVSLFGSLFADIYIKRQSDDGAKEELIKLPIKYGNGNMYLKAPQDETRENAQHSRILPAMAFELDSFESDRERKTNPMVRIQNIQTNDNGKKDFQFNKIPYNFEFTLKIRTKNTSDMLQIAEQIIPVFDGNMSVNIVGTDILSDNQDIIIVLGDVRMQDNYDDGLKIRLIEWDIKFTLKGYLYKKTQSKYVIKEIDIIGKSNFGFEDVLLYSTSDDLSDYDMNILSGLATDLSVNAPITKIVRRKRKEK